MRALLLLLLLPAALRAAELRPERVVLRTDAGDLEVALYAGAPRHAEKLLSLFSSGAYDTAPFFKIDPARFAHVGGVGRRLVPLPAAALSRIKRLPLEPGAAPHRAGVLAMAHDAADPDPLETSFVILLADLPGMDGRFTAVGEVAAGGAVLDALRAARVDSSGAPLKPLLVRKTEVLKAGAPPPELRGPDRAALGLDEDEAFRRRLLSLAALAAAAAAALWLCRARLGRPAAAAALLCALGAFFGAFAASADLAARARWVGPLLFVSAVGCFRLMNEFER